ncbi:riboflavin biosynthesis pyrimidine reductase [Paraburkholderia sp. JPY465]|uniref:dihydrofolate reductase family protein n=1 Tax=Paraburkholderia sp. JPY465 TaxID=3042285 RepID=UPI003D219F1A
MRPKIICHMIGSVDGRLLSDRWTPLPEGAEPNTILKVYDEAAQRMSAQGWIVGRKTMADMVSGTARSYGVANTSRSHSTYIGNRRERAIAVTVDPAGKLHYGTDHVGSDHLVTILSEQVSDEYLAELRDDGVSYLFAGADGQDLYTAMTTLGSQFDVQTVLLEGGGTINGAFLKADLIDEISLLVYPGIDGLAGVPSIFEYHGTSADELPAAGRTLLLLSVETLAAGVVWMRYAVDRRPAE